MIKILFICHGNICRSPMAEYIFKHLIKEAGCADGFLVASAATSTEEIGNDIYPPAKRILRAHGVPFERHHARQITAEDLSEYDRVIVMERYNLTNMIRRFGAEACKNVGMLLARDVSDPWYTDDFETAYRDIENGCRKLLSELAGNH